MQRADSKGEIVPRQGSTTACPGRQLSGRQDSAQDRHSPPLPGCESVETTGQHRAKETDEQSLPPMENEGRKLPAYPVPAPPPGTVSPDRPSEAPTRKAFSFLPGHFIYKKKGLEPCRFQFSQRVSSNVSIRTCQVFTVTSVIMSNYSKHIFLIRNSVIYLLIQQNIVYLHPKRR